MHELCQLFYNNVIWTVEYDQELFLNHKVLLSTVVSHKCNASSVPRGIVNLYSTVPWVTREAVTLVEGIT